MYFKCCYGYFWEGEFRYLVKEELSFFLLRYTFSVLFNNYILAFLVCMCVRMCVSTQMRVCTDTCLWRPKANSWVCVPAALHFVFRGTVSH